MKIAIIGSGAMGCLFGAYLSQKNEVCMICRRQKVVDSINREGLTVFEPDGSIGRYENVTACLSGEGQHFSYREVLNTVHAACESVADGFSSMSQDVMNCRISGNPSMYSVVANEETIVTEIPKNSFHNFISINPRNAGEIFDAMAMQIGLLTKNIEMLNNEANYHKASEEA